MAGRGRGLGRGRGKPKLQNIPPLSEENKQRLIKDGVTEPVTDQFADPVEVKKEMDKATDNVDDSISKGSPSSSTVTSPPQTNSPLNPKSKDFVPVKTEKTTPISNGTNDISAAAGRSKSSPAQLNPHSNEFVPKSRLNVMAVEFIPQSYLPPKPSSDEAPPTANESEFTTLDILEGFDRRSPIDDPLLVEVADMLINATLYPGTYDSSLQELSESLRNIPPTDELLQDIGDMLIQWGINNTGLRYTAVRMCEFMCKLDLKKRFRQPFFTRLQELFETEKNKPDERTSEEVEKLMEFSLFLAEMFYRVRVGTGDQVVWVLGLAVAELLFILIDIKLDETIKCGCNIIKLTGYLLENKTPITTSFNPLKKMDTLILALKHLCNDQSIGKRVCEVIINVLQFRGTKYGRAPAAKEQPTPDKVEAPVKHEEDWSEYLDESGNVIEGYEENDFEQFYDVDGADFDPNIDEEIMKGYEEFLQDFEDHLLLQEFGEHSAH